MPKTVVNAKSFTKIRYNIYDRKHRQDLAEMTIQHGQFAGRKMKELFYRPDVLHAYEYHRYYCCNYQMTSADGFGAILRDPQLSLLLFEFNVQVLLNAYTTQFHKINYEKGFTSYLGMECHDDAELNAARSRFQMHLLTNHNLLNLSEKKLGQFPEMESGPDEFTFDELDPDDFFMMAFAENLQKHPAHS